MGALEEKEQKGYWSGAGSLAKRRESPCQQAPASDPRYGFSEILNSHAEESGRKIPNITNN